MMLVNKTMRDIQRILRGEYKAKKQGVYSDSSESTSDLQDGGAYRI